MLVIGKVNLFRLFSSNAKMHYGEVMPPYGSLAVEPPAAQPLTKSVTTNLKSAFIPFVSSAVNPSSVSVKIESSIIELQS